MEKHRKQNSWPFWIAVTLIVMPVLYVASFGPACWAMGEMDGLDTMERIAEVSQHPNLTSILYQPLVKAIINGPEPLQSTLGWYVNLFGTRRVGVFGTEDGGRIMVWPALRLSRNEIPHDDKR